MPKTPDTAILQIARNTSGARIVLDQVTKSYANQPVSAVENFSMTAEPGELIMFVGPSGCGKTTTLRMLAGLITPSAGEVRCSPLTHTSCDATSAT